MGQPHVLTGSEANDADLVAAVRSGDVGAFEVLHRRHSARTYRTAMTVLNDREAAADAVQEAFTRALERLSQLRDPDAFGAWLASIARRAALDEGRRRSRVGNAGTHALEEIRSDAMGPDDEVAVRELAGRVTGCLAGLSRRDATILVMVAHLGFATDDLAAALGVSSGAAKVALHRARRRLQQQWDLQDQVRRRVAETAVSS